MLRRLGNRLSAPAEALALRDHRVLLDHKAQLALLALVQLVQQGLEQLEQQELPELVALQELQDQQDQKAWSGPIHGLRLLPTQSMRSCITTGRHIFAFRQILIIFQMHLQHTGI